MADHTTQRSRVGGMGWIIGGLVLILLLLFIVFGFGNRMPAEDGMQPAPTGDMTAPATEDAAPAPDPAPAPVE